MILNSPHFRVPAAAPAAAAAAKGKGKGKGEEAPVGPPLPSEMLPERVVTARVHAPLVAAFATALRAVSGLGAGAAPPGAFLWDAIYPRLAGRPAVNPTGRYLVRLFWAGEWRGVAVDDTLPFGEDGAPWFPTSGDAREMWPALLFKAWLKVTAALAPAAAADPLLMVTALTGLVTHAGAWHAPPLAAPGAWDALVAAAGGDGGAAHAARETPNERRTAEATAAAAGLARALGGIAAARAAAARGEPAPVGDSRPTTSAPPGTASAAGAPAAVVPGAAVRLLVTCVRPGVKGLEPGCTYAVRAGWGDYML